MRNDVQAGNLFLRPSLTDDYGNGRCRADIVRPRAAAS